MSHTSRTRHSAVASHANKTTCYFSIRARSIAYSICLVILPCLASVLPLPSPCPAPDATYIFACASTNTQLLSAKMEMLT
ncbi:uncharacterized protein K441DRAFT_662012 [Cenococcum geophilum 1.58]|uniref:uncharacterized protein n=1 Tax=Cenococcum geophilum 1.58 TaxID=794803 RepID=UPI00358F2B22|nr:hypothetical protein K441DRAFT_662012 [Cenococcum geophilum 1.58]